MSTNVDGWKIRDPDSDEIGKYPQPAVAKFVVASRRDEETKVVNWANQVSEPPPVAFRGEERKLMILWKQNRKRRLSETDGYLSFESRGAPWLPKGWSLDVAPVGCTLAHLEKWFEYAIAVARQAEDRDDAAEHVPTPRNLVYHAHLILQRREIGWSATSWTKMNQLECVNELNGMLVHFRQLEHDSDRKAIHSADFTSVNWFCAEYQFAKGLQAESVRVLWEAWENGTPSLSEQTIGQEAGSSNDRFRLQHVFKPTNKKTSKRESHPAWGTMIKSTGKGKFALSPP